MKKNEWLDYSVYNVESFSLIECSDGTYGPECRNLCGNCSDGDWCNHVNGSCPNGCVAGVSGDTCDTGKNIDWIIKYRLKTNIWKLKQRYF